ncbi:hypothetical protein ARALYDRAFT_918966 [Arabidopsis lyrata subsp. lyrata]|uniref:Uncharacterized protein n=1 Tax=Arabidopsis lyrata subsp. lyrata TaxID=81972 RepID=D7MNW4_ARALL|nr:hypothetical protein ARALYDRAFT_918966 [Arabidopsis lyrata subsp. lyrata]
MAHIPDIKLIRTDTTLDLSQKAEKGMNCLITRPCYLYYCLLLKDILSYRCGTRGK